MHIQITITAITAREERSKRRKGNNDIMLTSISEETLDKRKDSQLCRRTNSLNQNYRK